MASARQLSTQSTRSKADNPAPWAKLGPGLRPGAIQPRRLARPGGTWSPSADGEIPLETRCPTRVSIKTNKKERPSLLDGLSKRLRDLRVALLFSVLVDSGQKTGIKGEFRTLRSPTQGAALRTRKPFEKGLSESFISPAGGFYSPCGAERLI